MTRCVTPVPIRMFDQRISTTQPLFYTTLKLAASTTC